jgi:circadian clock protein KaiC
MSSHDFVQKLARMSSGIPGLDRVLAGGLFDGGVYIVEGMPGAGKTILANQICFHQVKSGRRVIYITLLAESHARLLQHLQSLTFFDPSVIPDRLTYVSGFRVLEEGGLQALLDLVRKEMRAQGATLVVLDGFAAVGETAATDRDFKKFVHELQVFASLASCTFFLLSSGSASDHVVVAPVHTMVDGLVRLTDHAFGARSQRELHVQKFRGSRYLRGVHSFEISDDGITVYPRLESFSADLADASGTDRLSTGIAGLDAMMHGGLRRGSTTMLLGPTGVGKTLFGYRFLSCSRPNEKGVLFSFYETPKSTIAKAYGIGVDLVARCQQGHLDLVWQSPVESSLDGIGSRILDAVDRSSAARLFIDGFDAFQNASAYPERVPQFFAALSRELHARGVTTMHSAELRAILAPQVEAPVRGISPLLDNLVLVRFVEDENQMRRAVAVLKMRDSSFDATLRELIIDDNGIRVGDVFGRATTESATTPKAAAPKAGKTKNASARFQRKTPPRKAASTRRRG